MSSFYTRNAHCFYDMSFIAMTPNLTDYSILRTRAQGPRAAMTMSAKALSILLLFATSTVRADDLAPRPALPIVEGYWKWERTSSEGFSREVRYLKLLAPDSSAATQSPAVFLALDIPEGRSSSNCVLVIPSGTNQMIIVVRPRDPDQPFEVFTGAISTMVKGIAFSAELTTRQGGEKGGAALRISYVGK